MTGRLTVLALAAISGAITAAIAVSGAAAQDVESPNPMRGVEKGALAGFVELPLFDPARRLPPPPPPPAPTVVEAPAPPPPEPPPVLQVVGLVQGKRNMAIVHEGGAEKAVILRNGEHVGNWTVVVRPLGVTLRNGARSVTYSIFVKTGAPAPAQNPMAVGQMSQRGRDE